MSDTRKIKDRREALEMSQKELAALVAKRAGTSFSQQALAHVEKKSSGSSRYMHFILQVLEEAERRRFGDTGPSGEAGARAARPLSRAGMKIIEAIEELDSEGRLPGVLADAILAMLKSAPPRQPGQRTEKASPEVIGGMTVQQAWAAQAQHEGEQRLLENAHFYHDEASRQISKIRSGKKKKTEESKPEEAKDKD